MAMRPPPPFPISLFQLFKSGCYSELLMISNDKLKSENHRVLANHIGPRISAALFFRGLISSPKAYGPLEELISEENPPLYGEFTLTEFYANFLSGPLGQPCFEYFKL
ncbi:hypothetical protein Ancab_013138 [Ancistrocladus abbreviatus]